MADTHKTLVALTNALLEWILILMLFLNSFFSYLIRKFASYNRLKPPCFFCSTVDHLLEPMRDVNPYQNIICESHAIEFLNLYYFPDRPKGPKVTSECSSCSKNFRANSVDRYFNSVPKIKSDYEENEEVEVIKAPVVNNKSGHIQVFDQIIPLEWTDSSTSCSSRSSLNGDENMVIKDEYHIGKQGCQQDEEDGEHKAFTIDSLMEKLKAERLLVCGLYIELDKERNASAIAANQAMAMITKLQEEKVAMQIESMQNQRMIDEQAEYDQEVFQLLNELVMKLENDKFELENELEMYKERFLYCEGKQKAEMMSHCALASCSITKESLDDTNVSDQKNLRTLEESVVEFDVERVWILDELKELDGSLMTSRNDLDKDLVSNRSLGEDFGYRRNRLLSAFDIEGIVEEAEASHSAWSQTSF